MRLQLMILGAFIGTFGLAGLAPATASGGGSSAGHGGGGGGGGRGGGGTIHAGTGHSGGALHGGAVHSSPGVRGQSELAKAGFVESRTETIDGHHATVAVFHHAPLSSSEKEHLRRYHFKGFNECAVHGACENGLGSGVQVYCRKAMNVAFSKDLECLSFNRSG